MTLYQGGIGLIFLEVMKIGGNMADSSATQNQKLLKLIETVGKMHQVRIYDVESKASFLKIYIDSALPIGIKTCEKFMKSLLFLLESEGLNNRECEVSTPGLERPLKKDWHFQSAVGQTIKITILKPGAKAGKNQHVLIGRLDKYQKPDNSIILNKGPGKLTIPLDMIIRACTVFTAQVKTKRSKKYEHD